MSLSPLSCHGTHFICNNLIGCYGYDDNLIPDIASEVSRSLDTPQFLVPRLLPSSPADDIGWARCSKRLFQQFSQFQLNITMAGRGALAKVAASTFLRTNYVHRYSMILFQSLYSIQNLI